MGVYIKNIELPKPKLSDAETIYDARIRVRPDGHAVIVVDDWGEIDSTDCPLVPVPPHGDLIDKKYAYQNTMAMGEHMRKIILKQIDLLPTIIPAEEA